MLIQSSYREKKNNPKSVFHGYTLTKGKINPEFTSSADQLLPLISSAVQHSPFSKISSVCSYRHLFFFFFSTWSFKR